MNTDPVSDKASQDSGADAALSRPSAAQPRQPPPSTQPDSSGRVSGGETQAPAGASEDDSATEAQRAMKQTSKTDHETGT